MSASKPSFLSTVGSRLKSFFAKALPIFEDITKGAVQAEPLVDIALDSTGNAPAAALYNTVAGEVLGAETAAIAAGTQNGTGAQKAAAVLSSSAVQKAFSDFEAAVGVAPHSTSQQLAYVNGVVATLNNLNPTPAQTGSPTTNTSAATNQQQQ